MTKPSIGEVMVMVVFLLIFWKRNVLELLSTKDAMALENSYMLWTTAGGITSVAEPIFDDTTFVYGVGTGAGAISSGCAHAPCFPSYHLRLRIKVGLCLPLPSTAHSEQCLPRAAVWVVPSCAL